MEHMFKIGRVRCVLCGFFLPKIRGKIVFEVYAYSGELFYIEYKCDTFGILDVMFSLENFFVVNLQHNVRWRQ